MADVPETVLAALAAPVARALPVIVGRIPPALAAELGRLAAPGQERPASLSDGALADPVTEARRELGPELAGQLLGALEATITELDLTGAPDLAGYLAPQPEGRRMVVFASSGNQSVTETATRFLQQLHPGSADLAASLTRQLAGHRLVAPLLAVSPDVTGEEPIAAAHGAAHLALAVAIANAAVGQWPAPSGRLASVAGPVGIGSRAAAVVGVAIGAGALLLRESPMPAGYAAALLEKIRAEYLLPARGNSMVAVSGHAFALAEGEAPATADFSGNGLVAVVPGGTLIRTGAADGTVAVQLQVVAQEPELEERGWDEVVEVSWRAAAGQASLPGQDRLAGPRRRLTTPPWPGDYRLRVHATGRDDADAGERYELVVWQAPAAPEIVYKRSDKLGYQLRGEPEPARPPQPERAYRWLAHSQLEIAATVTVVTGASAEDVLRAFGADPARPVGISALESSDEMWVAVLTAGDAVLAVENNGFQGSDGRVLCRASAGGRAASMFWNVNGMTRLSFAEGGQVLAAFEPGLEEAEEAEAAGPVAAALNGLDFDDYRDTSAKGLVAVERFTGHGFTEQDLKQIEDADIGYRIAPEGTGAPAAASTTASRGLAWLAERWDIDNDNSGFCLTFVRGISEREMLARFGADADVSHLRPWRGFSRDMTVQAGRAGEWVFAWEENHWQQGIRPEVLRRVSAGAEAVVVRYAKHAYLEFGFTAELAYAVDGGEVAAVRTARPPQWRGSDPGRFQPLAREVGIDGEERPPIRPPVQWIDRSALRAVLTLAERAWGLSLAEDELQGRKWLCAPVLPLLHPLPPPSPGGSHYVPGENVISLLLAHASDAETLQMLAARSHSLMAGTGLSEHRELADAVEAALAGHPPQITDEDPPGLILRRLALEEYETAVRGIGRRTPAEMKRLHQRAELTRVLRDVLAGHVDAGLAGEIRLLRAWEARDWPVTGLIPQNEAQRSWRAQVMTDLAAARARVPADALHAAQRRQEAWQRHA